MKTNIDKHIDAIRRVDGLPKPEKKPTLFQKIFKRKKVQDINAQIKIELEMIRHDHELLTKTLIEMTEQMKEIINEVNELKLNQEVIEQNIEPLATTCTGPKVANILLDAQIVSIEKEKIPEIMDQFAKCGITIRQIGFKDGGAK